MTGSFIALHNFVRPSLTLPTESFPLETTAVSSAVPTAASFLNNPLGKRFKF